MRHNRRAHPKQIKKVSIHASVKDATSSNSMTSIINSFNPRICKRCDYKGKSSSMSKKVSIHASVKDATRQTGNYNILTGFNPRICKRCDSMFVKSFIDDTFKL